MTATYSTPEALDLLCRLAQKSRLDIFRLLVQSGSSGLAAGVIARHCRLPAPTCSFHLKELKKGGLLHSFRQGRSRIYMVNFRAIRALLGYLTEHCCAEEELDDESPDATPRSPVPAGTGEGAPSGSVTPSRIRS